MRERVARLEQAITEAVKLASPALQQVINDLQALRGIADISAVTIAAELGQVSRFDSARQLMGYCGAVPSEDSSGKRIRRGGITKTANAHLRRIVVEAAWSYRRPPGIWYGLRRRQESISEEVKEIAWKAHHRLHKRYMKLGAAGKDQRKIVTAVARELLNFIWAIGTRAETVASHNLQPDKNQSKDKTFLGRKEQKHSTDERCHQSRTQSQQQPGQARRRILAWPMRQARPDSR